MVESRRVSPSFVKGEKMTIEEHLEYLLNMAEQGAGECCDYLGAKKQVGESYNAIRSALGMVTYDD